MGRSRDGPGQTSCFGTRGHTVHRPQHRDLCPEGNPCSSSPVAELHGPLLQEALQGLQSLSSHHQPCQEVRTTDLLLLALLRDWWPPRASTRSWGSFLILPPPPICLSSGTRLSLGEVWVLGWAGLRGWATKHQMTPGFHPPEGWGCQGLTASLGCFLQLRAQTTKGGGGRGGKLRLKAEP